MSKLQKIARIVGRSVPFRDFREGFATSLAHDSDVDIKIALGIAQTKAGALAVKVMETRFASTLMHEDDLRHEYDHVRKKAFPNRGKHLAAVHRMGTSLAIREFAGARNVRSELPRYAWMVCARRETLGEVMDECVLWLNGLCDKAIKEFNEALGGIRIERNKKRRAKRAAA